MSREPVLAVDDLVVEFEAPAGALRAVDGLCFDLFAGETLAIVGESGSGKTAAMRSVLGLLPRPPARVVAGKARFEGEDLLRLPAERLRSIRGSSISMVFQDPLTSLDPLRTIGYQVVESLRVHQPALSRRTAFERAVELLTAVGIADASRRAREYPHQWSGGMRQRASIAMALGNAPTVLIADEPTTALDVTTQAQVLELLRATHVAAGRSMILVTHDLGVVAEAADRVVVMYAGRVVEEGAVAQVLAAPRHPYTAGLLASVPNLCGDERSPQPMPGRPRHPLESVAGCGFHPRCALARGRARCRQEAPALVGVSGGQRSACHFADELATATAGADGDSTVVRR